MPKIRLMDPMRLWDSDGAAVAIAVAVAAETVSNAEDGTQQLELRRHRCDACAVFGAGR